VSNTFVSIHVPAAGTTPGYTARRGHYEKNLPIQINPLPLSGVLVDAFSATDYDRVTDERFAVESTGLLMLASGIVSNKGGY